MSKPGLRRYVPVREIPRVLGGMGTAVVATNMGEARNAVIVQSADAVIAVGGSWGTLSEVALAMRDLSGSPHTRAYLARVAERPAWQRAVATAK